MMNSVFIYLQLLKKRVIIIIVEKDKTNILFEVRRGNMKKSIILKSFLVILVCAMLVFTATSVYAANESSDELEDLIEDNSTTNNTNSGNTNSNSNSNTNSNTNTNRNSNTNNTSLNAIRNNTANNANANNLPKTGIEDSLPTVLLVVVFGISAVYAYKKIKDYRNID